MIGLVCESDAAVWVQGLAGDDDDNIEVDWQGVLMTAWTLIATLRALGLPLGPTYICDLEFRL